MSDQPISQLRQRMIEDMTIRGFSEATQRDYLRSVKSLSLFIGRSPDTATPNEIRQFQFNMRELLGVAAPVVGDAENVDDETTSPPDDAVAQPCPCCGGNMRIIEVFEADCEPRHIETPAGIDSS